MWYINSVPEDVGKIRRDNIKFLQDFLWKRLISVALAPRVQTCMWAGFCWRCRLKARHLIMRVSEKSFKTFTRKSHSNLLSVFAFVGSRNMLLDQFAYTHFLLLSNFSLFRGIKTKEPMNFDALNRKKNILLFIRKYKI